MTQTKFQQAKTYEDRIRSSEDAVANQAAGVGKSFVTYTADHTLTYEDMAFVVAMNKGTGVTLTLPQDSDAPLIAIGQRVKVYVLGAGQVTVAAGSGATLRKAGATAKSLAQYAELDIVKRAANTWSLHGELAAA